MRSQAEHRGRGGVKTARASAPFVAHR